MVTSWPRRRRPARATSFSRRVLVGQAGPGARAGVRSVCSPASSFTGSGRAWLLSITEATPSTPFFTSVRACVSSTRCCSLDRKRSAATAPAATINSNTTAAFISRRRGGGGIMR